MGCSDRDENYTHEREEIILQMHFYAHVHIYSMDFKHLVICANDSLVS